MLRIEGLEVRHGLLRAVEGVSLELRRGETLGLAGESGCGKSTLAKALVRLLPAHAGRVLFEGEDLLKLEGEALRQKRRRLQLIFQDPYASLNPRLTVGDSVAEPLRALSSLSRAEQQDRAATLLERCGLSVDQARVFPAQLSGGQRQRVAIARALALEPALVVADEPVSALDVSVRAQILALLRELQERLGLTYLFISHDLPTVRRVSQRIAVMYLGKVVEVGPAEEVSVRPLHPYSQALVAAVPVPDPVREKARPKVLLEGDVPSAASPPPGCRFHPRCPLYARLGAADQSRCRAEEPLLRTMGPEHVVACHFSRPSTAPSTDAA